MECFEKRIGTSNTKEDLLALSVDPPDDKIYQAILQNWDRVAKPLDGMGRFEALTAQIGAVLGTETPDISKRAVIILCADNGIVVEGISQSGQEVTAAVAAQMAKNASSVGKMASLVGADTIPIDIGINTKENIPGVLNRRIRCGTRNFRKEPAMTEEETIQAIFTGINLVSECKEKGYRLLATGEMGIGNTTTSSAVAAALLKCDVKAVTGRGAGLDDARFLRKQRIIAEALQNYALIGTSPLRILETVGGLDLAGLAGVCIGGGLFHIPIVLDGVISMTAALLADKIVPGTIRYLLASHKGKEPAVERLLNALQLEAVIDGKMALGEGTGAVMLFPLLDMALRVYQNQTTFADLQIQKYERFGS